MNTRTIFLPKSSTFHSVRLGLKAVLISSLLIFGHVLLTTTAHAPTSLQLTPALPSALSTLSALIFLTLLWLTFTLIEHTDISFRSTSEREIEGEKGMVFSRTWFEGVCGVVVLVFWSVYWKEAELIMEVYSQHLAGEFVYFLTLISQLALNLHLISSIFVYAVRNGFSSVGNYDFWMGKMGWWVGSVELGLVVVEGAGAGSEIDLEKGQHIA
ncbi:hypothetical protein I316_01999 [Kwoniella heveanensis BCC8398]|uniref:Uncharacterized protein n=1 Tax=Kwoniella heveanensis BCC8398 TaxID=1296120 RepID=A0A1B9GYL8_9TREE|nr:hypothetical protein I316_01999 [Kwoniella heveanensis BCC8398]